jgi:hypothetical protein
MGPFDETSRGQLNVDQAVASGIAATQPVATTTTGGAPSIPPPEDPTGGFQSNLQIETPQWAGLPSQQDFGRVDVRRGNYNTGMVPTVNVQMPFAALANRQAALGQRKAALDKQVADFDLYSKVGSPDARYAQAFNKYATQGMDQWLNDYAASMHGGDRRAAIRDIATNPEAGRMWMNKSKEFQAVAEENKKWMSVAEDRLAKHMSGEAIIKDKKALNSLMNYVAAVDDNRVPVEGMDAGEFVPLARQAVPEIQRLAYMEQILPALENSLQTMTGINIAERREGGNIVLNTKEVKSWDAAKKSILKEDERIIDMFDGDYKRAEEFLDAMLPTSVKKDMKFENPYTPPSGGSGSSKEVPAGAFAVDYSPLPVDAMSDIADLVKAADFPDQPEAAIPAFAKDMQFPYIPLFDVTSGQGVTARPRPFSKPKKSGGGDEQTYLIPERVVEIAGKKYIFGKVAPEAGTTKETDRMKIGDRDEFQDFKKLRSGYVPYKGNEGRLNSYFPWLTPDAVDSALGGRRPEIRRPMNAAPAQQQSKASTKPASDPLGIL